jgi:hypothetical protein
MITVRVTPPDPGFLVLAYRDWLVENVGKEDIAKSSLGGNWFGENWEFGWEDNTRRVQVHLADEKTATAFLLRWG